MWNKYLILVLVLSLSGCLTIPDPDNPSEVVQVPDYELIELGSYAAFSAILEQKESTDMSMVKALEIINEIESYLVPLSGTNEPLTIDVLRSIVRQKVPSAYAPLGELTLVMIQRVINKYQLHLDDAVTRSEELIRIAKAVLKGAKSAILPHIPDHKSVE